MNRSLLGSTALLMLWASVATAQAPTYLRSWPTSGDIPLGLATDGATRLYQVDEVGTVWIYSLTGTSLCSRTTLVAHEEYGIAFVPDGSFVFTSNYPLSGALVRRGFACSPVSAFDTAGQPTYLAADVANNVYVTEAASNRVEVFSKFGAPARAWSCPHPTGIAYRASVVYVVGGDGLVHSYFPDGTPWSSFAHGLCCPEQLAVDANGNLYAADMSLGQLRCFDANGTVLWTLGPNVPGYPYNPARFVSVTVSSDGTIFAGDYDHRRIVVLGAGVTPTLRRSFGALKAHYR
jgi:DNA-binding beta-propeller fold protein YncE